MCTGIGIASSRPILSVSWLLLVQSSQPPAACNWAPASIQGLAFIDAIKSDPNLYSRPGLYARIYGIYQQNNISMCFERIILYIHIQTSL